MSYELNDVARQLGNPIYNEQEPESMKEFSDAFEQTSAGRKFFAMYGADSVEDAWDLAIAKYKKIHYGEEITLSDFTQFVNSLILSGGLKPPAPPAPKEKQLSKSQLAWQEYRIYSENHSSSECRARAAVDPSYREFMNKNLERETVNRAPQLINLNANRTPAASASPELARFVEDYKVMPMDRVRKLSNAGTNPGGKPGADHFNALLNKAIELGSYKRRFTMPMTYHDQKELNATGVQNWFRKYNELFSIFRVEGTGGLKEKLAAFYNTEDHGRAELADLASRCLSEKEQMSFIRMNPDADMPNYDKIYMTLVEKLASQAFIELQERGALEDISSHR